MKILFVAVITFFFFYVDFPDRLAAEKEKSLKATVTGYHENKISMRSRYHVEAKAEDGKIYRNTDGWRFRWLSVGSATEITRGKKVYIGNFFLRMSAYPIVLPLALMVMLRKRKESETDND